jgi:aspartate aminotransferase
MNISQRLLDMEFSPVRKFVAYGEIAKNKGLKVHHLQIGQPDVETPKSFFDGINNFKDTVLKYSNSQGIDELINSFISYYKGINIDFGKNEIMITNGGSEAVYFAFMAVCNAGDNVIAPEPFYSNYKSFAKLAGIDIVSFVTKAEDGFHLPPRNKIAEKINSRTKAIIISNPCNPTGTVYTKKELRMLCDIAKEYDLYLISDEVYREFVYDDVEYFSPLYWEDMHNRIILIDSISKRYSACGARIGLIASKNDDLMSQVLKLCQSRLSSPTIDQLAAANLINTPKEYFAQVKAEYKIRRDILFEALNNMPGVICRKPAGAFYIVTKLPVKDAENFSKWLLTDFSYKGTTVMVAPAAGFYSTPGLGKDEVRISYCLNRDSLTQAMEAFGAGLSQYAKSLEKSSQDERTLQLTH